MIISSFQIMFVIHPYIFCCFSEFILGVATDPNVDSVSMYLGVLYTLVIACAGCERANLLSFGATQYDPAHPDAEKHSSQYFGHFYQAVNAGFILAAIWIAPIGVDGRT